jgi:small subunit ribosomal protein S8
MSSDSLGDMFTKIRNAILRRNKIVIIPSTKLTRSVTRALASEGLIDGFQENLECYLGNSILIGLKYKGNLAVRRPVITTLKRISKPGLRRYVRSNKIPSIAGGNGTVLLSTSKGIISGREAKKLSVGGEILGYIF